MTHLAAALDRLQQGHHLTAAETAAAFGAVMRGEATHGQIRALLLALKTKGETADEVAGAVQAMRQAMVRLPVASHESRVSGPATHDPRPATRDLRPATRDPRPLVDTCGTGGGTIPTFNISTTAAFVVAGAGVPVAKHGNRSFTSRSGSADVLEALGIDIALTPDRAAATLAAVGLVFLFAPTYHPAMRHAAPVRAELKTATIFNLLGPLSNPAGVTRQIVGVSDPERGPLVAEALARLGAEHALVVHAEVGMDEIAPAGVTHVWEVGGRRSPIPRASEGSPVSKWEIDPGTYGLRNDDLAALKGGDPPENAARLERLLRPASAGSVDDPAGRAAVLLNAAAAIYVSAEMEFGDAVAVARTALEAGKGAEVLDRLKGSA